MGLAGLERDRQPEVGGGLERAALGEARIGEKVKLKNPFKDQVILL